MKINGFILMKGDKMFPESFVLEKGPVRISGRGLQIEIEEEYLDNWQFRYVPVVMDVKS